MVYSRVFQQLHERVVQRLHQLDPALHYHNLAHTLDVVAQVARISRCEELPLEEYALLQIAALFHDTGFLYTYNGHEEESCRILAEEAQSMDLSHDDLEKIFRLIRVTHVDVIPSTLSERILCDADLDYLGRDDFPAISQQLKAEYVEQGIVKEEDWDTLQLNFLRSHRYYTPSSQRLREPVKQQHIRALMELSL